MRSGLRRYTTVGHRFVSGWIEPQILVVVEALARKQEELGVSGSVAEIGVHHGRFFLGLLLASQPSDRGVAIDLFADQDRNVDGSGRGDEAAFRRNLRRHAGSESGVAVVAADSSALSGEDIVKLADGQGARMFSVDGGHSASLVEHDMRTAEEALVPGGLAIGDDVFNSQWPGCAEGTLAFLDGDTALVPFAIGFNKVLLTDRDHATAYREVVSQLAERRLWLHRQSEMHGEPVTITWAAGPKDRTILAGVQALGKTSPRLLKMLRDRR